MIPHTREIYSKGKPLLEVRFGKNIILMTEVATEANLLLRNEPNYLIHKKTSDLWKRRSHMSYSIVLFFIFRFRI